MRAVANPGLSIPRRPGSNRTMRYFLALALAALSPAAPSRAAETAPCVGALTGAVSAKFECAATLTATAEGPLFFVGLRAPVDGVASFAPGAFLIDGPVEARTYTLATLGQGRASLAAEGGTLYTATKTTGQRGEVTLVLRSVKKDPARPGSWVIHGSFRTRLVPAASASRNEVVADVTF